MVFKKINLVPIPRLCGKKTAYKFIRCDSCQTNCKL